MEPGRALGTAPGSGGPGHHSIELIRQPLLGAPGPQLLVSAACLAALGTAALALAVRRLGVTLRR